MVSEFCYSQNSTIKNIIEAVILNKKSSDWKYINVDILKFDIDKFYVESVVDDLDKSDSIRSILQNAFNSNSASKSISISFNNLYDKRIKIIDKNDYNFPCTNNIYRTTSIKYGLKEDYKFCKNNCSLIINKKILWGKKKTQRKIDEFWKNYDSLNPKENFKYYELSNPLVSENNEFFLIQIKEVSENYSSTNIDLYKNKNGIWMKVSTVLYQSSHRTYQSNCK